MFPCCKRPLNDNEVANKTLFPATTCVTCALDTGTVFVPAPRFGALKLEWTAWGNIDEWNELQDESVVERAPPTRKRLDAFEKHLELQALQPNNEFVMWTQNIGLYGDGDSHTPRYLIRERDKRNQANAYEYVYLLRDIQSNVDKAQ